MFDDTFIATLNDLVPKASAEGAYCAGLITFLCWQELGRDPSRKVLEQALRCQSVAQAHELWKLYKATIQRNRAAKVQG